MLTSVRSGLLGPRRSRRKGWWGRPPAVALSLLVVACGGGSSNVPGGLVDPSSCRSQTLNEGGPRLPPSDATDGRVLTTREPNGFHLLGVSGLREYDPKFDAAVAEDSASLCALADRVNWTETRDVDFSRYVVFAFSVQNRGSNCNPLQEPAHLKLSADGRLQPRLLGPSSCAWFGKDDLRDVVRLLAIARVGLPKRGFIYELPDGSERGFWLAHPLGREEPDPLPEEPELPVPSERLGSARLPPAGQVELARLDDGAFVWVVRHRDETVSVLEATIGSFFRGYGGLGKLLIWDPQTRRFDERYDEFGVSRDSPNLARYAASIDEIGGVVRIGRKGPSLRRKHPEPLAGSEFDRASFFQTVRHTLDGFEALSVADAQRLANGVTVLLDAHLVFDPTQPPTICSPANHEHRACTGSAVPSVGLESIRVSERWVVRGPLVATVENGRFRDVAVTLESPLAKADGTK